MWLHSCHKGLSIIIVHSIIILRLPSFFILLKSLKSCGSPTCYWLTMNIINDKYGGATMEYLTLHFDRHAFYAIYTSLNWRLVCLINQNICKLEAKFACTNICCSILYFLFFVLNMLPWFYDLCHDTFHFSYVVIPFFIFLCDLSYDVMPFYLRLPPIVINFGNNGFGYWCVWCLCNDMVRWSWCRCCKCTHERTNEPIFN